MGFPCRQVVTLSVNSPKCKIYILIIFKRHDMYIAFLSLGSNLNEPLSQVKNAISEIELSAGIVQIISTSSLYETPPIGPKQPNFINAVIKISTTLAPQDLLSLVQKIELAHHRERLIHWGPRTLDIDILLYDNETIHTENLTIPHPFMHERAFVLVPLLEIEPELTTPQHGLLINRLEQLSDRHDIIQLSQ